MTDPLWARPIESLAPLIRTGRVSPVALTEACLDRIARHDHTLKSFIHLAGDALEQARRAEARIKRGD